MTAQDLEARPRVSRAAEMKDYMHRNLGVSYAAFVTEGLWAADVIAYRWSGGLVEFEIKTTRADLLGEIKCARVAWGLDHISTYTRKKVQDNLAERPDLNATQREMFLQYGHGLSTTKLDKHTHYATQHRKNRFIPNKFYFAVTPDLAELAKEKTQKLPYGVWSGGKIIKPAKQLKYQIIEKDLLWLLSRACTEREYIPKVKQ